MQLADIKKLANLARIDIDENELNDLANEFDAILAYVGQIQEVMVDSSLKLQLVKNVMRDDEVTNKKGEYTDKIIEQMPDSENGYLKVKQIL
jgi:aspartyl-tRNA(Asn)/glutamyl-tRNA(Gln) amidotransferase subunit C